jgi:hypothetical protein
VLNGTHGPLIPVSRNRREDFSIPARACAAERFARASTGNIEIKGREDT